MGAKNEFRNTKQKVCISEKPKFAKWSLRFGVPRVSSYIAHHHGPACLCLLAVTASMWKNQQPAVECRVPHNWHVSESECLRSNVSPFKSDPGNALGRTMGHATRACLSCAPRTPGQRVLFLLFLCRILWRHMALLELGRFPHSPEGSLRVTFMV